MFHKGFIPSTPYRPGLKRAHLRTVVLILSAFQYKFIKLVLIDPPAGPRMQHYFKSCGVFQEFPMRFKSLECRAEFVFTETLSDTAGTVSFVMLMAMFAVLYIHIYFRCGQQGKSAFFAPCLFIAIMLVGQFVGGGVICPMFPILFTLAKSFEPAHASKLGPPSYAYTATTLVTQFLVVLISFAVAFLPLTNPIWNYAVFVYMGYPFVSLPLAIVPKNTSPKAVVPTLSVFAFTFLKDASTPLWWLAVAQSAAAYHAGTPFTEMYYILTDDLAGFMVGMVGIYAVDYVSGDAPSHFRPMAILQRLALAGPASAAAAYFEAKEKESIRVAQEIQKLQPFTSVAFAEVLALAKYGTGGVRHKIWN
ncbi:hypothetical protein C8J57DRAFT_1622096 [Mycena rebaudengoi]|nr:hypothetical protein C8J57DRAFT_1622096 [Mycena rebaudengoi]